MQQFKHDYQERFNCELKEIPFGSDFFHLISKATKSQEERLYELPQLIPETVQHVFSFTNDKSDAQYVGFISTYNHQTQWITNISLKPGVSHQPILENWHPETAHYIKYQNPSDIIQALASNIMAMGLPPVGVIECNEDHILMYFPHRAAIQLTIAYSAESERIDVYVHDKPKDRVSFQISDPAQNQNLITCLSNLIYQNPGPGKPPSGAI